MDFSLKMGRISTPPVYLLIGGREQRRRGKAHRRVLGSVIAKRTEEQRRQSLALAEDQSLEVAVVF